MHLGSKQMLDQKAFRFALRPNGEQRRLFSRFAGAKSFVDPEPPPQHTVSGRVLKTWLWSLASLLVLALSGLGYALWSIHKLNQRTDNLGYDVTSHQYYLTNDVITADVGVIQFLHKGYFIKLNRVAYTPAGLELEGTLGNPTRFSVSGINLAITARPPLYKVSDKIIHDPSYMYKEWDIGSARTTVPLLAPGKSTPFSMTIPKVKQTTEGYELVVSIANERYSYY